MEADWGVEIGGGAPVLDALWEGLVDLRKFPERVDEIAEAAEFPPLAGLLTALNGDNSPLWTAKCDLWEPETEEVEDDLGGAGNSAPFAVDANRVALACYVDLLPMEGKVFARWEQAESFCRAWVSRLEEVNLGDCRAEMLVRQALAGPVEGFGVTAYLSAQGQDSAAAEGVLAAAMRIFAATIPVFPVVC